MIECKQKIYRNTDHWKFDVNNLGITMMMIVPLRLTLLYLVMCFSRLRNLSLVIQNADLQYDVNNSFVRQDSEQRRQVCLFNIPL